MSKKDEALKLAQDWYDSGHEDPDEFTAMIKEVIALAEESSDTEQPAQQQEPHEWLTGCPDCGMDSCDCDEGTWNPPASKPWVGLTQQDIDIAFDDTQEGGGFNEFARAIEAKLKEKNNG